MGLIVQKFGGSSVRDKERIFNVAKIITDTYKAGNEVVVVVSAQGDTTDDLIAKACEINENASKREMDMLLSTGEQISISLLAMAIEKMGFPVVSLTGWQAGFLTRSNHGAARIRRIKGERVRRELDNNNIVVVQLAADTFPLDPADPGRPMIGTGQEACLPSRQGNNREAHFFNRHCQQGYGNLLPCRKQHIHLPFRGIFVNFTGFRDQIVRRIPLGADHYHHFISSFIGICNNFRHIEDPFFVPDRTAAKFLYNKSHCQTSSNILL